MESWRVIIERMRNNAIKLDILKGFFLFRSQATEKDVQQPVAYHYILAKKNCVQGNRAS